MKSALDAQELATMMYFNPSGKNQTGEKNRETQIYDEVIMFL